MFDRACGNQWRALVACSLVLVACENPGRELAAVEGGGAAGSAALASPAGRETASSRDAAASEELQNELADASVRRPTASATTTCGDPVPTREGACEGRLSGVYGVAVSVDTYWSDEINPTAPAFDPGRGKLTAFLLAELEGLCPGDSEGELVTRVCDLQLPPIYSDATGGVVQLTIPHAAWERSSIPELTARVRTTGREKPGFEIVSPIVAMLGIELDSSDAAWPSHHDTALVTCGDGRSGADCFPDQDEDDYPGITLRAALNGTPPSAAAARKGGWRYTPVPTDESLPLAGTGATALFAGLRTKLGGAYGVGADCNGGSGAAAAGDLELRVFDCAMLDGAPCTVGNATVVDRNMPVFHALGAGQTPPKRWKSVSPAADQRLDRSASAGATNRLIRLNASGVVSSCADVRQAFTR